MTTRARVREADIARALRAAKKAGYAAARVTIDPLGNLSLEVSDAHLPTAANPLDRLLEPDDWR